jgi:hypothetical protein
MLNEPSVGKTFFGREDILHTLEKRVNALKGGYRQNVALTGQMLSGKSSILYQFLYGLNDRTLIPIYIEVVREPFPSFVDKFIATLLYNYFLSCGARLQKDLSVLLKMAEQCIPHTVYAIRKIKNHVSKRHYNDAYRNLLNLTSILKKETGKSCIVILDEFHNLEHFRIKKPYLHFGKIIMIQKDTMYVVSSSRKSTIRKILSEKLALLYGNFEIIEVAGFDSGVARGFLEEKLQGITLPQDYSDYLIDFTDGNPFYLDVISKKMAEVAHARKCSRVDDEIIVDAFTGLLYTTSGTVNQYFTNAIMALLDKNVREDSLDILIALACGRSKLKEITQWFHKKNSSGFAGKLARLIELDMVYKNGVFYEVHDKVFKFWLRTVYHEKRISLVDDIVSRADSFQKAVRDDIGAFREESRRSTFERIEELFSLFNGEMVEVGRKTRRLPRFFRIETHAFGDREDMVSYQNTKKYWVCEIARKRIDETAVADFVERYYPMRDTIAKKVCIALNGIDTNALLLAKEKNIWVWDLNSLNNLLRLFKRRGLICQ